MRRIAGLWFAAFLAAAALCVPGLAPAAPEHEESGQPPGYLSETLPNGLRVSILPAPDNPLVATQVWYHVGSANEDAGSRGLAHLFEHLMFGETKTRSKEDYSDYHHRCGGYENAYTSFDETVYVSEIGPEHHLGVLEREADRMVNLVLSQENLDNEKKIVTEELRLRTENDPMSRVLVAAQKALLGEHPYALWPTGTKENISAASLEACRNFYERYYRPNNVHLVIVGPVDPKSTLEAVRRLFGAIPSGGGPPSEVPSLLGWKFPEEVDLSEDLPPVETALLAFPLPPPDSSDNWAIEILEQLLSGGQVDPFREELVAHRHKAIEAGAEVFGFRRGSAIAFYSASLPYRRKSTAFRLIEETVGKLSKLEWLTEESLANAKRSLKRKELPQAYYSEGRADSIGRACWWLEDEARAFDRVARIDAVTLDQVREVYRKYVGQARPSRLYITPEHVPLLVRLFGWMYPLMHR